VSEVPEVDEAAILALEERAFNAWPGLQTVLLGGWALRLAGGCTKRANSAHPLHPSAPFDLVRGEAESFYKRADLPATFRISPLAPPEADAALAAAGYALVDPSQVMAAPLEITATASNVSVGETPTPAWLDGMANANGVALTMRKAHSAIIDAIRQPTAFATLRDGGLPVGFGMAVKERGMIGLFDIVVAPDRRGRGYGRAICQALLSWGAARGATGAYLQVRADNAVARALYSSLGFTPAYSYHYRMVMGRNA
jgi:ribosomal protein S18 acetylase RimI-like enzyme